MHLKPFGWSMSANAGTGWLPPYLVMPERPQKLVQSV
jgi:hypothetical protein